MGKEVFCLQGQLDFTTESRRFPPDDLPLLTASIRLPRWDGTGGRRFDRYYAAYGRAFFSYCQNELLPRAMAALELARQNGGALPEWTVSLDTVVTLQREDLLSLYTDTVERGDGRRLVLRRADTWDLTSGTPLPLGAFFPADLLWKRRLLGAVAQQIRQQQELGVALYRPDWRRAIRTAFSGDHFYLTERQLCLFYQMYAIAPPVEGIPVFPIPYDPGRGPRLPEQM